MRQQMPVIVDFMLVNIHWIVLVIIRRTNLFTMRWSRAVNLTEVKMIPRLHPQK